MTALVKIEIPWPDRALFPNEANGRHWAASYPARIAAKLDAQSQAQRWAGVFPSDSQLALRVVIAPPDNRRRDLDGVIAALKPTQDGLCLGLEIDDSRIRSTAYDWADAVAGGRVTLSIHLLAGSRRLS